MAATSTAVTIPRARLEAIARQALALREQADALMGLVQSELMANAADPRSTDSSPPATFGRRSA